jgi:copper homeostasis protein (lipoprotein)
MKLITYFIPLSLLALFVVSCTPSSDSEITHPDMHTSSVSLDWQGMYQGVVPCANCDGIQTSLTLKNDMQYVLYRVYLGESDSMFTSTGSFEWDETGNVVVLTGIDDGSSRYKVVEGAIVQLDIEGKEITGNIASNYRLTMFTETKMDQAMLKTLDDVINKKFMLVELMGNPYTAGLNDKAPYIIFNRTEKKTSGNAGCNTFIGTYELKDGYRIRFSQMGTTMMACPEMTIEQEFLKVLETADNYNYDGINLVLNRARMAPLARFVIEP